MSETTNANLEAETPRTASVPPSAFRGRLKRHGLTHQRAADLLGVSKRSLDYYATGAQPVTRTLALAMRGLEPELDRDRRKPGSETGT